MKVKGQIELKQDLLSQALGYIKDGWMDIYFRVSYSIINNKCITIKNVTRVPITEPKINDVPKSYVGKS